MKLSHRTPMRFLLVLSVTPFVLVSARKFSINGPVLTLTLKDPTSSTGSRTLIDDNASTTSELNQFLSLDGLSPVVSWGVSSSSKPFPETIPALQSVSVTTGYEYEVMRRGPSFVEADVKLGGDSFDVRLSPRYDLKKNKGKMGVKLGLGERLLGSMMFSSRGKILERVSGSYRLPLSLTSVSSLTFEPSFDLTKNSPTCTIVGESQGSRTSAILDLNWEDPRLRVVHALDERNTIAPEISLHTAKIFYRWDVQLPSGSSIVTKVDPTSAIAVTWTDRSRCGGKWVTDFNLPLVGSPGPLAADVRVRRQFVF